MNPERALINIMFIVDTNCVNGRQLMPAMNQLEKWASEEIIILETTEIAQGEMVAGNNHARASKAYQFIYTISEISTSEEAHKLKQIENILFPQGGLTKNQKNDVEIVFNSWKYLSPLITNDGGSKSQPGGILGNKEKLKSIGINVITPDEAVLIVKNALISRDEYAKQWAEYYKEEVPFWVGKD